MFGGGAGRANGDESISMGPRLSQYTSSRDQSDDLMAESQIAAGDAPEIQYPSFSDGEGIFQRIGSAPANCQTRSSGCLLRSVYEADGTGEIGSLVDDNGDADDQRSGTLERYSNVAGRQGNSPVAREDKNYGASPELSEDGPGWNSPEKSHRRSYPIERRREDSPQKRKGVVEEESSAALPFRKPERFHEEVSEQETSSGDQELYRTEKGQSKEGSGKAPDGVGGKPIGAQTTLSDDVQVHTEPRCSGVCQKSRDDGVDALIVPGLETRKDRVLQGILSDKLLKPPPMKINLMDYQSPEQSAVMMPMAGYRSLEVSLGKQPGVFTGREAARGLELNTPAVETIRWDEVQKSADPARWEIISVILDPVKFQQNVLRELEKVESLERPRSPSLPEDILRQIEEKGYVYRAYAPPRCVCPLFCVPRPDGKLRLIWDGRKLNDRCKKPPRFHLRSTLDHVRKLLNPNVKAFYTIDMKTWFVQMKPHPKVATYFMTWLKDGIFIMCGLPMGWAWAPIIAQFVAETVAKKIVELLPELSKGGVVIVYIDNIILGLPEELAGKESHVRSKCEEACAKLGAVIKAGSEQFGRTVEWLGVEISGEKRQFRLKESFIKKFRCLSMPVTIEPPAILTYREWYAILSCIIYAFWTRQGTLFELSKIIQWMASLGKDISLIPTISWETPTSSAADLLSTLRKKIAQILPNRWIKPPIDPEEVECKGVGISDASYEAWAWAFHSPKTMTICIFPSVSTSRTDIFERELLAMVEGQRKLLKEMPGNSSYVWWGDNMGALFASRRELSCLWKVNRSLEEIHQLKELHRVGAVFAYVESEKNVMDKPSRTKSSYYGTHPPCRLHPGQLCPCFKKWIKSITEHMETEY